LAHPRNFAAEFGAIIILLKLERDSFFTYRQRKIRKIPIGIEEFQSSQRINISLHTPIRAVRQ